MSGSKQATIEDAAMTREELVAELKRLRAQVREFETTSGQRKRTEEALVESEQRFKDFAASASQWLWEMGPNLRFSFVSEGYEKATGNPPDHAIGKKREELGDADLTEKHWIEHLADLSAHRSFADFEYTQNLPDGRIAHFAISGIPRFRNDGTFLGYRGTGRDITERKKTEEALRLNAQTLADAQHLAKIGYWIFSFECNEYIGFSDEMARIFSIPLTRLMQDNREEVERAVHPDDRDHATKTWAWRAEDAHDYKIEYRIIRPDGKLLHVVEIGEPIRDASGRVIGERGTIQDITERKETEETLRLNAQALAEAQRLAKIGHWTWSFERDDFITLSEEFARIYGLPMARILEDNQGELERLLHPEDRDYVVKSWIWKAGEARVFQTDYRIIRPDGEVRHVVETGEPMRDASGRVIGERGTVQDITERKQAEDALKQSEAQTARAREQLVEAIETISEGFAWYDAEDRLFLCNSRYRELYGDSAEFIVSGAQFEDILRKGAERGQYAEAVGRVEEWLRERVEQHQNPKGTFYQQLGDGRWLQIEERKLPGGGIVGIRTEITRLKEMEDELVRKERLATLGQLTGTVSHELRNPLGAIRTSIAAIKKLTADIELPRLGDTVDIADRSITRCDKIIADLLDFTRLPKLQSQTTSIDPWLEEELDELSLAPAIMLRRELTSGAAIAFDRDRLDRALRNVADNAIQAMAGEPDGPDKILTVRTAVVDARLEITVSDTGPGIAPPDIPKVLQPLFSTKSFGVGLGMPMVQQILEQHGGGIEITSEPGRGTDVILWLPLEIGEPEIEP